MKPDARILVLQQQATRLTLDPAHGGSIRELQWSGLDLLRPTPPGAVEDPLQMACFPMVPYVNRIEGGRFEFGRHRVCLSRNWSGDPNPLHGQGWRSAWNIAAVDQARATLCFDGGGDEWPWRYRCEQRFELRDEGLSVELSIENLAAEAMPALLGLHPYFPAPRRAQLAAGAPRVWLTDERAVAREEAPVPSGWGFEPARAVSMVPLDNTFSGWDGHARLSWPDRHITLRAESCSHLHVYAPAGEDFFCVEPQSAAPGALSRAPFSGTVLQPGARLAIRVDLAAGRP